MPPKPKVAIYWAASCGGCEIAFVNLHERLLDVDLHFELAFCPCLVDTKKRDVEAMPDGALALTLFNGAIRTDENEEMAWLMRRKSQLLVAFGSCATEGCIPALANLASRQRMVETLFRSGPTLDNPAGVVPAPRTATPFGDLHLPALHERVRTLADVVPVDYRMPGCPPESHQIWNVVDALVRGLPLPPKGSVIGAGRAAVCDECPKKREEKRITELRRIHEVVLDPSRCILDQGVLCLGPATRDGCGGLCPKVDMPCIGCYGPCEGVLDQGAKMASLLGGALDVEPLKGLREEEVLKRIDAALDAVPDWAGAFYKFSLGGSLLKPPTGGTSR